jgi:hypothetical protein
MRLADDQIKTGILHADRDVRDVAVGYFTDSLSKDRAVMPLAIQAMETYGWQEAFADVESLQLLPQNDQTISWLIAQFHQFGDTPDQRQWAFLEDLSWVVASADAGLLKRRRKEILTVRWLDAAARQAVAERTRLLTVPPATCWSDLQVHCQRLGGGQADNSTWYHALHLVEAISRHREEYGSRILAVLDTPSGPPTSAEREWHTVLMIRAAGQMGLTPSVDAIVHYLQNSPVDWVQDECTTALTRVGGDATVKAVWNACALAPERMMSPSAWVLEAIHTDLAVEALLDLFQRADDRETRIDLGHALLAQLVTESIEPIRQLVLNEAGDEAARELQTHLVAAASLAGWEFPELAAWRAVSETPSAWQAEDAGFPVVETWSQPLQQTPAPSRRPPAPGRFGVPARRYRGVGRNDPCPCGSGKKYKNCCLRKQ